MGEATLDEGLRARLTAFTEIPLVDVSALGGPGEAEVAGRIGRAAEEVGFLYVTGHGIPEATREAAFDAARRFFALPEARKLPLHISNSPVHRGYFPLFEENTDPTLTADLKEGFDLARDLPADDPDVLAGKPLHGANVWPDEALVPGFRAAIETYYGALRRLGERLMRGFALALDLPPDWFADKIDRPLAQLRLLHYPPQGGHVTARTLGCGAHSDYGCLTILAQDAVGGLQLLNAAGDWVEAPPLPGTFVINLGDQMARWTNGRFAATKHRVINASGRERYSLPFFFDPNFDTRVEVLPSCLAPGETPRFAPVLAGEYLLSRYDDTFSYRQDKA